MAVGSERLEALPMAGFDYPTERKTLSPFHKGAVFQFLRRIRFMDETYPFSLRGTDYLKSPWKRSMDLTLGLVGIISAAPFVGLSALATKIESLFLPVFITQTRYDGSRERDFEMHKMRTMSVNFEATGEILPTGVGKVLRSTSIDELPQLLNVVKGEMSLVGRRPMIQVFLDNLEQWMCVHLPYERAKKRFGFTDEHWIQGDLPIEMQQQVREYAERMRLVTLSYWSEFAKGTEGRPGITGLYQVFGRRQVAEHHRLRLDLFYERRASLGLDLAILLATIPAVISKRGAF